MEAEVRQEKSYYTAGFGGGERGFSSRASRGTQAADVLTLDQGN